MTTKTYSIITGTGSYIPDHVVTNQDFVKNVFYENNGTVLNKENEEVVKKFQEITTIAERRYVQDDMLASEIALLAAEEAIITSGVDRESIDFIIVGHNFGDVSDATNRVDIVPSVASKVKQKLGILNPNCVAYDVIFGCPGWLHGVIQAEMFIKAGEAHKALIIGTDTVSKVADPHDRDSMIYADGAGAVVLEVTESEKPVGILAHKTRSDTFNYASMLHMGPSYNKEDKKSMYLKMNGRKLYQYALETVPVAIKACLDKAGVHINEISKVLIHQANGKMDDAILKRLYELYGIKDVPHDVMPMSISWLGNSSVATVPTLLDLILKGHMEGHEIKEGDKVVFASVGAGMNINAVVYQY
jgi:3-oxoacyl-[acyl-carrier-protein] synthase III